MRLFLVLVIGVFMSGCAVFGVRTAEELSYKVIEKDNNIEVRKYAPYISAQAEMKGDYEETQGKLFKTIAGYIFGDNQAKTEIAMTAPVNIEPQEAQSEKIAMTAPVILEPSSVEGSGEQVWKMSFSMPSKYTLRTLPKPSSDQVQLVEISERLIVSLRYSGSFDSIKSRNKNSQKLLAWLEKNPNYKMAGDISFAGYDPPFTLPFLRRNEVHIPVEFLQN